MPINGKVYDWESITISGPGGTLVGAQSVDYKDSAKVENVYGKGRIALGRSRGNYEASGTLEMLKDDADKLCGSLGADYMGTADFTVTVSYANDGGTSATDVLQECVVTDRGVTAGQGDSSVKEKLDISIKKILRNGVDPATK